MTARTLGFCRAALTFGIQTTTAARRFQAAGCLSAWRLRLRWLLLCIGLLLTSSRKRALHQHRAASACRLAFASHRIFGSMHFR